jgi:hypothetical protein
MERWTLLLAPQFSEPRWRLPTPAVGDRWLIGWKVIPDAVDAGPPDVVARLLMKVLCRQAAIAVPVAIRPPTGQALVARRWELHRHFEWITSTDPDEARQRIFDGDHFSWSEQAQVAILLLRGAPVSLSAEHLDLAAQPSLFASLAAAGAGGVLLPGVDGAVAGLYLFAPEWSAIVRGDLEAEAQRTGGKVVVACVTDLRHGRMVWCQPKVDTLGDLRKQITAQRAVWQLLTELYTLPPLPPLPPAAEE